MKPKCTTCPGRVAVRAPSLPDSYSIPFSIPGSQRDRQLLHFYGSQSALDLGGSLNRELWYNIVLQHSQQYAVLRQAVIAFGAIHWHALLLPRDDEVEHIKKYNIAIRSFRKYLSSGSHLDPHVVLLCIALFFNWESGCGDPERAMEHLENGLRFLKSILNHQSSSDNSLKRSSNYQAIELINTSVLHLFSRLDFQASVYDDSRVPIMPLMQGLELHHSEPFRSIQYIQNNLGILMSRTLRFLVSANEYKYSPEEDIPMWIRNEKANLLMQFNSWDERLLAFTESPYYDCGENSSDTAAQFRVFKVNHRLCRMFLQFSFPHNPEVFTQHRNTDIREILSTCRTIAESLRPALGTLPQGGGIWKFTSELAILPSLILLAVKSPDRSIRREAINQIELLSGYREGLLDATIACQLLLVVEKHVESTPSLGSKQER